MDIKEALKQLKEHCEPALKSGIITEKDRISVRSGETAWITAEGAKPGSLTENDLVPLNMGSSDSGKDRTAIIHSELYAQYERLGAIVSSRTPYSLAVSQKGETVKPYVDDIAQIAGIDIRCVDSVNLKKIKSVFKWRSAVLIKNSGSICADRSLDDALATAMITEKACRIHVQARYIGGAKPINVFESALMRYIYVKKYSKIKY